MTPEEYKNISGSIPNGPGVYKYFDLDNNLIYVGKAKNLRKRITSYFIKTFVSYKTYELVQRIGKIEFTIVNSEQDAFLLENSLIKQTENGSEYLGPYTSVGKVRELLNFIKQTIQLRTCSLNLTEKNITKKKL